MQTTLAIQAAAPSDVAADPVEPSDRPASAVARANFRAMADALGETQPTALDRGVLAAAVESLPWAYARDGSLTVRSPDGWWDGCSLPARASRQQLRTLDVGGPVACFLDPPHPAYLRTALDKLGPAQALIALVPDAATLPVLLAADDLSADVAAHRLWFVAGAEWPDQLRALFRDRPGLASPTQFVRLTLPDSGRLDPAIADCRQLLTDVASERTAMARDRNAAWVARQPRSLAGAAGVAAIDTPDDGSTVSPSPLRLCVVTARTFRLNDDAGLALAEMAAGPDAAAAAGVRIDALCGDDPASSSTFEMLRRATAGDALLTADFSRAELPDLLPAALPWVTWVTTPRVPPAASAGPNDRLILADPAWLPLARSAGWAAGAVTVGGWPGVPLPPAAVQGPHVAVLADTVSLDAPAKLEEFSSHRLLWNAIRDELSADPLAVGADVEAFLTTRLGRFDVDPATLDRRRFVRDLIEPAVAQTVVCRLVADGVAVRAHGAGWDAVPGLSAVACRPLASRAAMAEAARAAAAVLDVRPVSHRTGLHALGRPVVRCGGRTHLAIKQDIATALAGRAALPPAVPPISVALVGEVLRRST